VTPSAAAKIYYQAKQTDRNDFRLEDFYYVGILRLVFILDGGSYCYRNNHLMTQSYLHKAIFQPIFPLFDEKPFERQKAGIPDPKAVSYYHNGTFQSVCHHYGAKAGDTIFQEAFTRYKDQGSTDHQIPVWTGPRFLFFLESFFPGPIGFGPCIPDKDNREQFPASP